MNENSNMVEFLIKVLISTVGFSAARTQVSMHKTENDVWAQLLLQQQPPQRREHQGEGLLFRCLEHLKKTSDRTLD